MLLMLLERCGHNIHRPFVTQLSKLSVAELSEPGKGVKQHVFGCCKIKLFS